MRPALRLALAAFPAAALLMLPHHPVGFVAPPTLPVELLLLLPALLALGRVGTELAALAALALSLIAALKLLDIAAFSAFARRFDPAVDLSLIASGWTLLSGSIGRAGAGLAAGGLILGLLAAGGLAFLGLRVWARAGARLSALPRLAAGAVALAAGLVVLPEHPGFTTRLAADHLADYRRSRAALAEFAAAAQGDPWRDRPGAMGALGGRDVAVVFVESYGRAAFDNPAYAARHRATLTEGARALAASGLAIRSGWLTAPIEGGQSWLAHATLAAGLTVGDQNRYGAVLASPRLTLYDIAARAGYRTLAVAPAIVLPWPEAANLGFQTVLAAADLGYRGQPFDWVTMPDQYTLHAFDRLAPRDAPLMTEIALISSHAPWTPLPRPVPWDAVGDGRLFDAMTREGPSPQALWRDRDRVRHQFGLALDYAVTTVLDWAALPRDMPPLLVVLGDHQPAGFVARTGGADVPVHLIGPPEVLALFDGWGWTPGPEPAPDLPPWPMAAFRDRFLEATVLRAEEGL